MRRPRFEELDYQETPIGAVSLRRRIHPSTGEDVYEVKLDDDFLMSSTFTAAEIALTRMALAEAPERPLRVVVGGLGLGYTAAAALDDPRVSDLLVIDALAPVIGWHRDHLVPLGRRLTQDPRCRLLEGDFFTLASSGLGGEGKDPVDVVLVDIDHSPQHLLNARHAPFYEIPGIREVADQLRPGGVFALWSDDPPDEDYLARLRAVMPDADAHVVRFPDATGDREATNTVYIATAIGPGESQPS